MGCIPDGWQRIIRDLQGQANGVEGYISLKVENEDLGLVLDDTWVSPTGAVQVGNSKNFSYVDGKIVYTGEPDVLVSLQSYQAVTIAGLTAEVNGTGGLNGVPCENFAMPASSSFGNVAVADNQCRFEMFTGDTLDAFVKHTEGGPANVTLTKGVYHVTILDVI